MAARKQGEVLLRERTRGRVYALRFWAYGERRYLTLGESATAGLGTKPTRNCRTSWPTFAVASGCHQGRTRPPLTRAPTGPRCRSSAPSPWASASREGQVAEEDDRAREWALGHLLPFFADWAINEIDVEAVDDYRLRQGEGVRGAGPRDRAGQAEAKRSRSDPPAALGRVDQPDHRPPAVGALDRDRIQRFGITENAAEGKRRRLSESRRPPSTSTPPHQIEALLEAAADLDRDPATNSPNARR